MSTRARRSRSAILAFRKISAAIRWDMEGRELDKQLSGAATLLGWATI